MKRLSLKNTYLSFLCFSFLGAFGQSKDCYCAQFNENSDIQILIESSDNICKAKGYELLSKKLLSRKELDSAEIYVQKALSILEKNGCNQGSKLNNFKTLDVIYTTRADFTNALDIELKIASIFETINDTVGTANSFLNISNVFNRIKQSDKGIAYCRKAIPIVLSLKPSNDKASLLTKVAHRYYFYFEDFKDKTYLDTMELYTNMAYDILKKATVDRKIKLLIYTRLITLAIEKKDYPLALEYINNNLQICDREKDIPELAVNYSDKAEIYLNMKQYDLAKQYADSSLIFTKLTQSPPHIANIYNLLYKIAKASGNTEVALSVFEFEKQIRDSLNKAEKVKAINELEKKYNQAKNEKTIKELDQERRIYLLFTLAALLGIIIFIFHLRQQRLKHNQIIMETEQRLNRARMNPHFFFNALTSLQSFALRENDGKSLASNISKFSHIMRETLESSYKEYVTIEQEMEFLNEYLEIQKIRFPKKFSYEIKAENDVEIDELLIPSMIIQPFVENSIEHGFEGLEEEGHVIVLFKKDKNEISIEISDNGKGLNTSLKLPNQHISRASQIIKDRIYLLNIKLKTKARFSIDNQENGKGVRVKIYLPQIFENESTNR